MTASEYYDSTPAEISIKVEIFNRKQLQKHQEIITIAYLSAYYNRIKKMPKLQDLLQPKEQIDDKQKADALLEKLKALNAQLGGDIY